MIAVTYKRRIRNKCLEDGILPYVCNHPRTPLLYLSVKETIQGDSWDSSPFLITRNLGNDRARLLIEGGMYIGITELN